jgi:excisionase family DNA binding protein
MGTVREEQPGEQGGVAVWLVTSEAAARARVGPKTIFREVRAGRLKAARVGGRRELRFRASWVDAWLEARSTPVVINGGQTGC